MLLSKRRRLVRRPSNRVCKLVHYTWDGDKLHVEERGVYYTTLKCSVVFWKKRCAMNKAIITVVGQDTVGIIARVCTYLSEHKVNVLDISTASST